MSAVSLGFPKGILDEWTEIDTHLGASHFDERLHDGNDLMAREGIVGLASTNVDAEGYVRVGLEGGKSSPLEGLSDLDVGVRQKGAGHVVAEGGQREVVRRSPRQGAVERCRIVIDRILGQRNARIGRPIFAKALHYTSMGRSHIAEH